MRIDRVKYTAHYDEFGQLKDQWIGLEAAIDDTEVPEKQLDAIKDITEQWYRKQNPHLHPQAPQRFDEGNSYIGPRVIEKKPEDKEIGVTVESIMSCQDIVTLQTYYMLLDKLGNEELKKAYAIRKSQLVAKETKEILDATNALTEATVDGHKLLDGFNKNTKIKK